MLRRNLSRKPSQKQRYFEAELKAIRDELWARAEGSCELMIPNVCAGSRNLQIHHRRSRRIRKDGKANILENLLLLCPPCHALVHHERGWARDHGFIISTNADPLKVHVNRSAMWNP
jgi:5-methylcytosine-specific restriction endonuclease McrA